MEDEKIVELFFARSDKAIEELARKYGRLCETVAENILKNKSDAEECVNDAYWGVWNTIPPERPQGLRSYVCRIVRNLSIKKYHYNTAAKRNSFYDAALEELAECIPSAQSTQDEWEAKELAEALNRFLVALDKESRILFVRRYWYADSIADLAKRFQITNHNVSVRLSRIRKKLHVFLRKEEIFL